MEEINSIKYELAVAEARVVSLKQKLRAAESRYSDTQDVLYQTSQKNTSNLMTARPAPCAQPPSCRLLSLPPELRNYIYDLSFCERTTGTIDLLHATPPSKNLLLTCREIYEEAKLLYRSIWRDFWTSAVFHLDIRHNNQQRLYWEVFCKITDIARVSLKRRIGYASPFGRENTLNHIAHLTVTVHHKDRNGNRGRARYALVAHGLWRCDEAPEHEPQILGRCVSFNVGWSNGSYQRAYASWSDSLAELREYVKRCDAVRLQEQLMTVFGANQYLMSRQDTERGSHIEDLKRQERS